MRRFGKFSRVPSPLASANVPILVEIEAVRTL